MVTCPLLVIEQQLEASTARHKQVLPGKTSVSWMVTSGEQEDIPSGAEELLGRPGERAPEGSSGQMTMNVSLPSSQQARTPAMTPHPVLRRNKLIEVAIPLESQQAF
jgi:hypothetical protein